MKAKYGVALAIGSFALGVAAIQTLHAQAKPPVYMVAEINVRDKAGYEKDFLPPVLKNIKENGGTYLAGGFDKAQAWSGLPVANRYVILKFDSMDHAKAFYNDKQREFERTVGGKYADFRIIAVEGGEMK
ncbi:MAG: DUF1330 domain-containing protein [Xanthobacteraceae bacterium]